MPPTTRLEALLQQCYVAFDDASSRLESIYNLGTATLTSSTLDVHQILKNILQTLEIHSQRIRQPMSNSERAQAYDILASCEEELHHANEQLRQLERAFIQSLPANTSARIDSTTDTVPKHILSRARRIDQIPDRTREDTQHRNRTRSHPREEEPSTAEMKAQQTNTARAESRSGHTSGSMLPNTDVVMAYTAYSNDINLLEKAAPVDRPRAMAAAGDHQSISKPKADDADDTDDADNAVAVAEKDDHSVAEGRLPTDRKPTADASAAPHRRAGPRRLRAVDFF